jgi:predicted Rossmann fold flavoprotein
MNEDKLEDKQENKLYDVIIIGSGGAGMMSAISAYNSGYKDILIIEKLPQIASKLRASGGGKCNLTNTLSKERFIDGFGKNGRFMSNALDEFDNNDLIKFFDKIGLETSSLDGFRVFPASKSSASVIDAFYNELKRLGIQINLNETATNIITKNSKIVGLQTSTIPHQTIYQTSHIIVATGGKGYSKLGGGDDGYRLIENMDKIKHTITPLYPAMLPLFTKEKWVANCRANTIAKAKIKLTKTSKYDFEGDLIFTKDGIRGPVVLDMAREITAKLELENNSSLIIYINMIQNTNEEILYKDIKNHSKTSSNILDIVQHFLPKSVAYELLNIAQIKPNLKYKEIKGEKKEALIKLLLWTPLTIIGHGGFESAMVTRGGIKLNEVDSKTMQSKLIEGLYFCGEVLNLDGKCGGYNLQWAFSSGYLAGKLNRYSK